MNISNRTLIRGDNLEAMRKFPDACIDLIATDPPYRYVVEFRLRHNRRPMDTIDQMAAIVKHAAGRRLPYQELIAG